MCLVPGSPVDGRNLVHTSIGLGQVEGTDEVHIPMPCSVTNKTIAGSNALRKLMQEGIAVTSLSGITVIKRSQE